MTTERRNASGIGFTDLLFNTLVGFVFLFVISFLLIQPPVPVNKKIDPKAELIITLTWEKGNYSDIDLWVRDPEGNVISFKGKSKGLMHLDRDDLGNANDTMVLADGTVVATDENREVATIRGWIPGEWNVNIHYYAARGRSKVTGDKKVKPLGPIPVTVDLIRVNPFKEITISKLTLLEPGQETTAFNFTVTRIDEPGRHLTSGGEDSFAYRVTNINTLQIPFVYQRGGMWMREPGQSDQSAIDEIRSADQQSTSEVGNEQSDDDHLLPHEVDGNAPWDGT
jgi:hypothetical protein